MEQWYLIRTKPSRERQVAVQLYQRGFGVYLPLIWVGPAKRRSARERAYFPGYLFARLNLRAVGLDVIRWVPGVRNLVSFSDEPVSISEAFIAELQQYLNRARSVGGTALKAGRSVDFIHVTPGPFQGYEGIFNVHLVGADRTRILLACVQQESWRQSAQAEPGPQGPEASAARPGP